MDFTSIRRLAGSAVGLTTVVVCAAALCAPAASASGGQAPGAQDPNPLRGQDARWWTMDRKWDPRVIDARKLRRSGRRADAAAIARLAEVPQFRWWGQWETPLAGKLRKTFQVMDAKYGADRVPLMTVLRHQGKECHSRYLAGGAKEDAAYRRWIRTFARGIGRREVVLAFEPDSMGTIECLAKSRRKARIRMLAFGVKTLSKLPNATVYIDAGASDWQGVPTMARKLRAVGVRRVRGFMLNATHQDTTAHNIAYGTKLSRALGGKHFIVNTSANGNGPWYKGGRAKRWCNPRNAAAGALPTTNTGNPLVDAFMWVERPGYSNGACNGGPAKVGAWWRERALQMVRRAKWFR